jgi:hypothetical protein
MLYSDLPGTYYGVCTICWLYDTSSCHCEDPFLFLEINVYEMFCIKEKKRVFTILKSISCISTSTGTLSLFFFTPCLTSSSSFPSLSLSLSLSPWPQKLEQILLSIKYSQQKQKWSKYGTIMKMLGAINLSTLAT